MNWVSLSALIVNWFTIGLLLGMNRSLRKRNDRLTDELMSERMNRMMDRMDAMKDRINSQLFQPQPRISSLDDPPDPYPTMISQTTQDIIRKAGWLHSGHPSIRPRSTKQAPDYDKTCRGCGRPITQAMGTWRDHSGRYECDGRVTQLERHEP